MAEENKKGRFKKKARLVLKHAFVYYLTNFLAFILFFAFLGIIESYPSYSFIDLSEYLVFIAVLALPAAFYAMIFTIIPYLIFISIISFFKIRSLVVYGFFGTLTTVFVIVREMQHYSTEDYNNIQNIWFLVSIVISGAICGWFYGYMTRVKDEKAS